MTKNKRNTKHNKMEDGHFKSKNIKHGRKESARAVFGMNHQEHSTDK